MKIVCSLNTKLELIDYNLFEKTKKNQEEENVKYMKLTCSLYIFIYLQSNTSPKIYWVLFLGTWIMPL